MGGGSPFPGLFDGSPSSVTDFRTEWSQWRTQEFCSAEGCQQIQLRTEDRENGIWGR